LQRVDGIAAKSNKNLGFDCVKREDISVLQANQDGVVDVDRGGRRKEEIKPKFILTPGDCSIRQA